MEKVLQLLQSLGLDGQAQASDPRVEALKQLQAEQGMSDMDRYAIDQMHGNRVPQGTRQFEDDQFVEAEPIGFGEQFYPNASRFSPKGIRGGDTMHGNSGGRKPPRFDPKEERHMMNIGYEGEAMPPDVYDDRGMGVTVPDRVNRRGPYMPPAFSEEAGRAYDRKYMQGPEEEMRMMEEQKMLDFILEQMGSGK